MNELIYNKQALVDELNEMIHKWSSEKPQTRTLAHLGREAGVTDSALRRLKNQKVKISDDMIYRILGTILGTTEHDSIRENITGSIHLSKWLLRHYSFLADSSALQAYKHSPVAEEITLNPIGFSVFGLVSSIDGVTMAYVRDQFGVRGEIEAENLIKSGVLALDGDTLTVADGPNKVKITKEQTIDLLPEITKMYLKKDHVYNFRALEIEGVSKEGYQVICGIFEKCLHQVSEAMATHKGEIPVVYAGFFDSLTTQPYFNGDKNEVPN